MRTLHRAPGPRLGGEGSGAHDDQTNLTQDTQHDNDPRDPRRRRRIIIGTVVGAVGVGAAVLIPLAASGGSAQHHGVEAGKSAKPVSGKSHAATPTPGSSKNVTGIALSPNAQPNTAIDLCTVIPAQVIFKVLENSGYEGGSDLNVNCTVYDNGYINGAQWTLASGSGPISGAVQGGVLERSGPVPPSSVVNANVDGQSALWDPQSPSYDVYVGNYNVDLVVPPVPGEDDGTPAGLQADQHNEAAWLPVAQQMVGAYFGN